MTDNLKKYRIRKLEQRGKITVWQVYGNLVRNELDEEFTNFGQHYQFSFIPEYEFWLDRESRPDEKEFFISHLLVEWRMMRQGHSRIKAITAADKKELAERRKTDDVVKVLGAGGQPDSQKVHQQLLKNLPNGISVWLVYGRLVRSAFFIDFTEGGHDYVYKFIPHNEVWIDNDVSSKERPYVIIHELYERKLMKGGLKYPAAHKQASRVEWESRKNDEFYIKELRELGWQ